MTTAWVIGASGLLGSALRRAIDRRDDWTRLEATGLPWHADDNVFEAAMRERAQQLASQAEAGGGWAVLWSAGRAVPATDAGDVDAERRRARLALRVLREELSDAPGGRLFYASSAGGVYAGSADPPFTEATVPVPTSPYGRLKLDLEQAFGDTAIEMAIPVVIGRIANLYGPDQDLAKPQGVISHLGMARFTARMASLYVPLDTMRDYIHTDDAAEIVLDAIEVASAGRAVTTKIICSGAPVTLSTVLATLRMVTHGRPRAILGASDLAARQSADLRLRSQTWPELDRRMYRSLAEGIAGAAQGVLSEIERHGIVGTTR